MSTPFIKPQGALQFNAKQIQAVIDRCGYVLGTVKVDGIRALLEIDDDLKGHVLSRSGKPIPALAHLKGDFSNIFWQPGRFDFEATVEGMQFRDGTGRLRTKAPLPLDQLVVHPIQYQLKGADSQPFDLRQSMADSATDTMVERLGVKRGQMHMEPLDSLEQAQQYYEWARSIGMEGAILHDPRGEVQSGKVLGWWKMKPEEEEDGKITGYFEGQGQFAGMLGGFEVALESGETTRVGTGFTSEQRQTFWDEREALVGRYVQLRFMERTGAGGLRHPSWDGFRDLPESPGVKS